MTRLMVLMVDISALRERSHIYIHTSIFIHVCPRNGHIPYYLKIIKIIIPYAIALLTTFDFFIIHFVSYTCYKNNLPSVINYNAYKTGDNVYAEFLHPPCCN